MIKNIYYFKNIYAKYVLFAYKIMINYLPNPKYAEEITQDVFVQLNDSVAKF